MSSTSNLLLVVHVPKTAGTSFRHALVKCFGRSKVICDYGPKANRTSDIVRECEYGLGNIQSGNIVARAVSAKAKALTGHFPVEKYARYFDQENIISFAREPLERTCSEYIHRVTHADYRESFDQFIEQPSIMNMQARYLQHVPESAFIGLTARYSESLKYINRTFGLKLREFQKNIRENGGGLGLMNNLSEDQIDRFYSLNAKDVELYNGIVEQFATKVLG